MLPQHKENMTKCSHKTEGEFQLIWLAALAASQKYVTNIIAEPKYKYGQQEQVTVRKNNRSTAKKSIIYEITCISLWMIAIFESLYTHSLFEPAHEIMVLMVHIRAVSPEPSLFAHIKYGSRRRVRPKNQTSSPTGWLRMRVCRMSLWRTKSAIVSWDGSFCHQFFVLIVPLVSMQLWLH